MRGRSARSLEHPIKPAPYEHAKFTAVGLGYLILHRGLRVHQALIGDQVIDRDGRLGVSCALLA